PGRNGGGHHRPPVRPLNWTRLHVKGPDVMSAETDPSPTTEHTSGLLPSQALRRLLDEGVLWAEEPVADEQIQPASIDLRLGRFAYRVRAAFLPGAGSTVEDKIASFGMHRIDLTDGAVLERGCVYLAPLMERARLPQDLAGIA